MKAHEAWVGVMRDVGSIAKGDRNKDQGFDFRGIDATMNTVGPAFRVHGVSVLPVAVEILESERYETKKGTLMHGMVTRHDWLVLGPTGESLTYPDGSPVILQTLGQAADSGDKVATKASSVAYRTALLQSLTVPTGDRDPDADSHERAAHPASGRDWVAEAAEAKDDDAVRALWRECSGFGELTETLRLTFTNRAARLHDLKIPAVAAAAAAAAARAEAPDPWQTPAPEVIDTPLPLPEGGVA